VLLTGADVIVRKAWQFMARLSSPDDECTGTGARHDAHERFHLVKKRGLLPGADVIVRTVRRFIAHQRPGECVPFGSRARHEWLELAHDDIGARKEAITLRLPDE
jgi:hypothetical protein